ncbi:MAG: hypothetical protein IEMM0002_0848 [bacterium]|nr:MAG: hypothetical protein IEMM0002_0848 [bacterium]
MLLFVVVLAPLALSCADLSAYRYRQMYAMVNPHENHDRTFQDENLAFRFEIREKKIEVFITNKSGSEIKLDWPDVKYIDASGSKHGVANSQTLFTKNVDRTRPTILKPGRTEENVIVPLKNIEKLEQWTWSIKPFFNQEDEEALSNKGSLFSVIIPVELAGDEAEGKISKLYSFRFKVTNVIPYRNHTPR